MEAQLLPQTDDISNMDNSQDGTLVRVDEEIPCTSAAALRDLELAQEEIPCTSAVALRQTAALESAPKEIPCSSSMALARLQAENRCFRSDPSAVYDEDSLMGLDANEIEALLDHSLGFGALEYKLLGRPENWVEAPQDWEVPTSDRRLPAMLVDQVQSELRYGLESRMRFSLGMDEIAFRVTATPSGMFSIRFH